MSVLDRKMFEKFRDLIYEKSGITLGEQKEALVSARIGKRMRALGLTSYEDYFKCLVNKDSDQELVHMLDAISTNVTSFYREPDHFTLLEELLALWRDEGQQRFRIWSAASSTGEEPYTIAMVMHEVLGSRPPDMRILATDISTRVLEKCCTGIYDKDKLRTVPAAMRERYFTRTGTRENPQFAVKDTLKRLLTFRRLNLSTPPFPRKGPLDVVFCRNVMIYFDNQVRNRLLGEIYRLLKPGGYLMVGHAESLTGMMSNFKSVRPSVYIK